MTPPVTKLPYIPPDEKSASHFDPFAFDNPRLRMVSEKSKLTFADVGNMHVQRHKVSDRRRHFTPAFANNDAQLRLVLAQRAWSFVHPQSRVPDDVACDREKLEKLCAEKIARDRKRFDARSPYDPQWVNLGHAVLTGEKRGGYLGLRARVAILSWRLGWDCCTIAEDCQMSPQLVRQILCRLCVIARGLGFETFTRHKTCGKKKPRRKRAYHWWTEKRKEELHNLKARGLSWRQIAYQMNLKHRISAAMAYHHFFGAKKKIPASC